MSHTPGPWTLDEDAQHQPERFYGGPDGYYGIRIPGRGQITGFIGDANAHLIAAAPELLEALKNLLQYIDEHDWGTIPEGVTADQARAAIAKAEGRS